MINLIGMMINSDGRSPTRGEVIGSSPISDSRFTLLKFLELKILTVLVNDRGYRGADILNGSILVKVKTDKRIGWLKMICLTAWKDRQFYREVNKSMMDMREIELLFVVGRFT